MSSGPFGETSPRGDRVLESAPQSRRASYDDSVMPNSPYLKVWCPLLINELTCREISERADFREVPSPRCATISEHDTVPVELRLWPLLKNLCPGDQALQPGSDSLPVKASIDRSREYRTLLEVQKRGRWKSHKSVARYEKSAILASNFQLLSSKHQHHCLVAESRPAAVMQGQAPAVPLP